MDIPAMLKSLVRKGLFVLIGAVALVALTIPVQASLITYNFSGTVTGVDASLSSLFSNGQTLTGSYTFESTTTPRTGSTSGFAVYDALTALSFSIGSYSASSTAAQEIQVDSGANGAPNDRYAVVSRVSDGLTGPAVNGNPLNFFSFRLDDLSNSQFGTALTLPTSLSLSNFNGLSNDGVNQFFVFFGDPAAPLVVDGTLTGLSQPSAVPEPATMMLLGSGLLGLVGFRRRFRK
jgi:hypothetical protein